MSQKDAIMEIIATHATCSRDAIKRDHTLQAIGLDSLRLILCLLEIQRAADKKILDVHTIQNIKTVADLLALV